METANKQLLRHVYARSRKAMCSRCSTAWPTTSSGPSSAARRSAPRARSPLVQFDDLDAPVFGPALLGVIRGRRRQHANARAAQPLGVGAMVGDQRLGHGLGPAPRELDIVVVGALGVGGGRKRAR